MAKQILVVDDEERIRQSLHGILKDEGYEVLEAKDGVQALKQIESDPPDLVLLDIWMPGMDGMEVLERIKGPTPNLPVIMISGHANIELAVKATKLGAYDFVEKPLSLEKVLLTVNNALSFSKLEQENRALRQQIQGKYEMVGDSPEIQHLKEQIKIVAPTNGWVLITGENGTGKELVAREIHQLSLRADKPFVEVNCAAIPEELIESELFGHEKGSFTGALSKRRGKFDLANEGTIFLDEIADMSFKTQAKILRILQEQKFERVGGAEMTFVDVRVIAATNRNLQEEMQKGRFREDLYYRLNVIPLAVPPLRERKTDIPILVEHFIADFCLENHKELKRISPEAMDLLISYLWPGNVRELKNVVERMVIMTRGGMIEAKDVPDPVREQRRAQPEFSFLEYNLLKDARREFEKRFIRKKLLENGENISKTAEVIGIERSNLHRKIKSYGIEFKKEA
ncbi:MAG: sigma-54-dependent Fis family transcriptional regulator [Deltaproteobacteria bacterium]|nr:sigma-54-dependent Fis family transcriptional regulator [Deltaproteobacteria bacterium]